eukprot:TRINITY_DN18791_c0_g1_i1.p1 TRINITY_DN18791_c0_g1~~TRINITY_DN18791_c0_g1_i1.p1  ORF type:complete len:440 (-),score=105.80 TRINITY_DN18791_c0_g1_i1:129-1334(-)
MMSTTTRAADLAPPPAEPAQAPAAPAPAPASATAAAAAAACVACGSNACASVATCPVAVDIGQILVKVVCFGDRAAVTPLPRFTSVESSPNFRHGSVEKQRSRGIIKVSSGRVLQFLKFPVQCSEEFYNWLQETPALEYYLGGEREINATGSGAEAYSKMVKERTGVSFRIKDETACLIRGLNFLLAHTDADEIFTFEGNTKKFLPTKGLAPPGQDTIFPYLLVRVGSGVSIYKVQNATSFERVSGSAIGGGTFWGLCKLLTDAKKYEQAKEYTVKGDNRKVDLQVGDIYGRDYSSMGLKSDTIASCFAKVQRATDLSTFKQEDLARSAMFMVTVNIGQVAYLNAMIGGVQTIFFTGSFMRDNPIVHERLSWAISFWSGGSMKALFHQHDGYLAALGALMS